jgi:adenylate cyclase
MPEGERIDAETLASRTGVEPDRIEELARLGILDHGADGSFAAHGLATARLAFAFEASGITLEDLGAAITNGQLPELSRLVLGEPVGLRPRSHAEMARELGLTYALTGRFLGALGLPEAEPDAPIRDDDAELLEVGAAAIGTGLPEETVMRTLRVFAEHLDRMAEHQRALFRSDVQDRMIESGVPRTRMLEESAEIRQRLVELGFRTTFLVHRRLLERQQFENTAEQLELLFDELGVRRRSDHAPEAIVFVDLSGFTRLTEEEGDELAAERSREFANAVRTAAGRHRGRVIKLLGDGAMLHFESAGDAAAAASAVVDLAEEAGLPAARAGIAVGPLIRRDGDYFGRTVNLASRICDAAAAGTVSATREVADLTDGLSWTPIGEADLKGVPDPVTLVRLSPAAAGGRASSQDR